MVLGQTYRPRVIDTELVRSLGTAGAVVIEGARATGKTMTALNAAGSYVFVDGPEAQALLAVSPRALLEGPRPRLLDEWQTAPELWNLVRRAVDASPDPGSFILTGSAVPDDDHTRHTGAGRFLRLRERTMSWWEKNGSPSGGVSVGSLFDGERPAPALDVAPDLDSVIDELLRPGFPAMTDLDHVNSAQRLRAYLDDVARADVHRIANVRHEPQVIRQLIAALARNVATEVSFRTLAADVRSIAPAIAADTVSHYVDLLQRLFVVEAQPAWGPTLRSRARVRTAPRLHLADPALAAAAMGAGPERLIKDLETLGILFESAVVHDLAIFASALGGTVSHYRDSNGHEVDAIISLPDGRWGAVEVKLGGRQFTAGADSLARVVSHIDVSTMGEPSFLMVVTGTGPIVTSDAGVVTAPLSALAP